MVVGFHLFLSIALGWLEAAALDDLIYYFNGVVDGYYLWMVSEHEKPYVGIELLIPLGFRTTYGALPDWVGWG